MILSQGRRNYNFLFGLSFFYEVFLGFDVGENRKKKFSNICGFIAGNLLSFEVPLKPNKWKLKFSGNSCLLIINLYLEGLVEVIKNPRKKKIAGVDQDELVDDLELLANPDSSFC
ncbi:hypothetical protein SAY86_020141 [Trapa natans]|uniref:Uncharacterized protein n=1 Tax=Trapa natans TaxID=22666 RepID=A0AAN7R3X3_TRANT|nr:hypothetical protein SAY86_020141 [Trapa natans]